MKGNLTVCVDYPSPLRPNDDTLPELLEFIGEMVEEAMLNHHTLIDIHGGVKRCLTHMTFFDNNSAQLETWEDEEAA